MIELYPHNIPTLEELNEKVEKYRKVALLQGTGTGKTFVIGKHIEEHDYKNVLVLVPNISIGEQWIDTIPNVTVMTYQAMLNGVDKKYDLVVADEMHHLGSEAWGKKFLELFMQDTEQKVIGATATEIRYLDNSRDMAEELFDGVAVRGIDLATAISMGILPSPKYVTAYHGSEQEFDKYKEKINSIADKKQREYLSRRLEMCIQNRTTIKTAMYENLSMANHKMVVFLNGLCEIDEAVEMFADIFFDCECNYVSSKQSDRENKCNITLFRQSKKQISILFAVDMLNEGVHIKGVDTIVMFRNTESPRIYFQQIGRCLDTNGDTERVIFDFVGNAKGIKANIRTGTETSIIREINKKISNKKRRIIIKTYTEEMQEVLERIERLTNLHFSEYERLYVLENNDKPLKVIAEHLGRSEQAIRCYCDRNGIEINIRRKRHLTKGEIKYIGDNIHKTAREIGRELGYDHKFILEYCKNNGITLGGSRKGRVYQINPQNEEIVCIHDSRKSASESVSKRLGKKVIIKMCSDANKHKHSTSYGFLWIYEDEYKKQD